MNIIFTHEIIKLAGKTSLNNLDKVITRISFKLKGEISTPSVEEVTKDFGMFLQSPNPDNFIPYSGLTEEIVSIWVKTNPSYESICGFIAKELGKKINPNNEVIKEFDFDEPTFPWVSPTPFPTSISISPDVTPTPTIIE
jgi:hypothetical protein